MDEKTRNEKTKVQEPSFHFKTGYITIGEESTAGKILVSELVIAEQLLADFPDFEKFASLGFTKIQLAAGNNVNFNEDSNSFIAAVPGYPKIQHTQAKNSLEQKIILSLEPLFVITPDAMKATLAIHPALPDGCSLLNTNLSDLLSSAGITYGIDPDALSQAQKYISQSEPEFNKIVVARGRPASPGKDASLHFKIEIGPIAGTILENGAIDFRDRKIMVGIQKGQVIAKKRPAIPGESGINILGEETSVPQGKDFKIRVRGDAIFSKETMLVTATRDGILSIVNNNVIKVSSRQIIPGDIDYTTGNIDSRSCVSIRGSVQPGFHVVADGDLEIIGNVMSATIKSQGNVVIKGGITGTKSVITTEGDCDINFIEQGKIISGGRCVVRKQSYYSNIHSGSDIRCRDSSKIMGGSLKAEGNITVSNVGSKDCKPSFLAAGVIAERLDHYRKLKDQIIEEQDTIIQWIQQYPDSFRSKKIRKMEQNVSKLKLQLLQMNMIPGTGIYSRVGVNTDKITESGPEYSIKGGINIGEITIDVRGTIFAGTQIRIGNRTLRLDKTVSGRQFVLHDNQKRIIAKPIKK